jgi:hypothetical protein
VLASAWKVSVITNARTLEIVVPATVHRWALQPVLVREIKRVPWPLLISETTLVTMPSVLVTELQQLLVIIPAMMEDAKACMELWMMIAAMALPLVRGSRTTWKLEATVAIVKNVANVCRTHTIHSWFLQEVVMRRSLMVVLLTL